MHTRVSELYIRYNKELRPLISEIEGRNERFEEPLLLNVASMYDAIALSEAGMEEEERLFFLNRAFYFLELSISHSYQYLIKNLDEKMQAFEKRCKPSDRVLIDGGNFIGKYVSLKQQAQERVRQGREKSDVDALKDFKQAYEYYSGIEKLIDRELPVQVMQNTRKESLKWTILGWITSISISVIVGKLFMKWF